MPTGPKGQKRPADVIGNAVRVMKIATGEMEEDAPVDDVLRENAIKAAARGRARALKLTPEQRAEIAKVAAQTRWKKSV
jgi:hypothetical protein